MIHLLSDADELPRLPLPPRRQPSSTACVRTNCPNTATRGTFGRCLCFEHRFNRDVEVTLAPGVTLADELRLNGGA